jgi:hypothetical protein
MRELLGREARILPKLHAACVSKDTYLSELRFEAPGWLAKFPQKVRPAAENAFNLVLRTAHRLEP